MTTQIWRLGALLGAVALAACGGGNGVAVCSTAEDCAVGQSCVDGVCTLGSIDSGVTTCSFNTDCATGDICSGGVCTRATDGGTGAAIGAACATNASCASGVCLTGNGFTGGYCSAPCATHACPASAECLDLTSTPVDEKACAAECTTNANCRSGYTCCPGFENTCVPTAFCAALDGGSGGGSAGGSGGGSAGGSGGGSAGGSGGGSAGGSGGGSAGGSGGGSAGGSGGGSAGGSGGGTGTTDGGAPGDGGTPECTTANLINGGTAGPANQPAACQKPVLAPTLPPGAVVQNLGRTQVGTTASFFVDAGVGTISIIQQVWDAGAPDTITFTASSGSEDVPNFITPLALTDPTGNSYMTFDSNWQVPADSSVLEVEQDDFHVGTEALTLPNTSQALTHETSGYATGNWTFSPGDFAYLCNTNESIFVKWYQGFDVDSCSGGSSTTYYDVRVITKPIIGANGTVDIGLYMVSTNWTAAQAMTDPNWARFVSSLETLLGYQGLCLGKVTFYDVPAWAKTAYASGLTDADTEPCGNLYQMFTLSTSANALNFFFVDAIDTTTNTIGIDSGNGTNVGPGNDNLAGATPQPLGVGGTEYSGVAIDVSDLSTACAGGIDYVNCGADALAYTAAHKAGHSMGLYHPTEGILDGSGNAYFDTLNDTPQCDPTNCDADGDGFIEPSECTDDSAATGTCGGGDELMFWSVDATSAGNISPQQGQVIRASTVVQASATTSSRSTK